MFYPQPAFISAVVSLALLLPLPPLDQAWGMVSGQADVTAAGCGTDSAPDTAGEERLRAERQFHPARQRHKERAVGADSVWTLSVVFVWVGHTCTEERKQRKPHIHTRMQNAASEKKRWKNISYCLMKTVLRRITERQTAWMQWIQVWLRVKVLCWN